MFLSKAQEKYRYIRLHSKWKKKGPSKGTVKKVQRQLTKREEIFANEMYSVRNVERTLTS